MSAKESIYAVQGFREGHRFRNAMGVWRLARSTSPVPKCERVFLDRLARDDLGLNLLPLLKSLIDAVLPIDVLLVDEVRPRLLLECRRKLAHG